MSDFDYEGLLMQMGYVCAGTAATCFVVGEVTRNVSQVDKLWSLMPVVYAGMAWVAAGGFADLRVSLMFLAVSMWGARLTWNFALRGGYSWKFWTGEEDYRWEHVRKWPVLNTAAGWFVFDLLFICCYQMFLLLLISIPIVECVNRGPVTPYDVACFVSFLGMLLMEAVADWQQYSFQTEKYALKAKSKELPYPFSVGFRVTGLFSATRHPNYFAEQSMWVIIFLFTLGLPTPTPAIFSLPFRWSWIGCFLLVLLFQGSSDLSEGITAKKYPLYSKYQTLVPRFFPDPSMLFQSSRDDLYSKMQAKTS